MDTYKEKVCKYYQYVDNNKFESLFSLFSQAILYVRCEKEIKGLNKLKRFYLKERRIKGRHKIDEIIQSDKIVVVRGIFESENFILRFADFFYFNDKGLIEKRYTYLAKGYDSTV